MMAFWIPSTTWGFDIWLGAHVVIAIGVICYISFMERETKSEETK